jgi:hypothetical protein
VKKKGKWFERNQLGHLVPVPQDIYPNLEELDEQITKNRQKIDSFKNFKRLVDEENTEELILYFSQYGISPTITQNNKVLEALIEEELRDLER